jgi:peptidylprolyl isomerase
VRPPRRPRAVALVFVLVSVSALATSACGGDDDDLRSDPTNSLPATTCLEDRSKPEVEVPTAPPGELETEDLEVGEGIEATAGRTVTMDYVGVAQSSGEQFDASWDGGEPVTFVLGTGNVIEGWHRGIEGMKVCGRRMLVIPPDLGYGAQGFPPVIGPNETLVFVVDLVSVQ